MERVYGRMEKVTFMMENTLNQKNRDGDLNSILIMSNMKAISFKIRGMEKVCIPMLLKINYKATKANF